MSSNTPRAFARTLVSRISQRSSRISQHVSAEQLRTTATRLGTSAARLRAGAAPSVRTALNNTTAALSPRGGAVPAQRVPAMVVLLAAAGVAVAPLATSGAGDTHNAAAAKPAAATASVQPGTGSADGSTAAGAGSTGTTAQPQQAAAANPAPAAAPQQPAPAAAPASPYAGVSMAEISPTSSQGHQSHISPTAAQWSNATKIVQTAENMGLPPYASTVAVATALQESKLKNLTVAVDHDSLGLFQQRPSTGWGSPSELTDPNYAARAFLKSLPSDYQSIPLHTAAQEVQRSFNGWLYAQWQDQAKHMVYTIMHQQ